MYFTLTTFYFMKMVLFKLNIKSGAHKIKYGIETFVIYYKSLLLFWRYCPVSYILRMYLLVLCFNIFFFISAFDQCPKTQAVKPRVTLRNDTERDWMENLTISPHFFLSSTTSCPSWTGCPSSGLQSHFYVQNHTSKVRVILKWRHTNLGFFDPIPPLS